MISAILVSGCATKVYRTQLEVYCPPIAQYSEEFNAALADELDALPDNSTIPMVVTDYAKLRDRIRTCEQEKDNVNG